MPARDSNIILLREVPSLLRRSKPVQTISSGTPPAEIEIDTALVRALLREQHPDLAAERIEAFEAGWDNAMFRLGPRLLMRMPRREAAASLVEKEQQWLWQLPPLPLPIPKPERVGQPAHGFPWHWSIVPWIEGEAADVAPPDPSEAHALADFLKALHQPAPGAAPINPYRGCRLIDRQETVDARLERLRVATTAVTRKVLAAWREALAAKTSNAQVWIHGDLHARNVLVHGRKLASVVDWGDLSAGDPATDLASIWALFDTSESRRKALARYEASPDLLVRARGWAIVLGTLLLDSGRVDNDRHGKMGADMLRRVADDRFD